MLWTDEQQAVLERMAPTAYASDIGKAVGKSRNAVIGRARRSGVRLQDQLTASVRNSAERHQARLEDGYQPKKRTA